MLVAVSPYHITTREAPAPAALLLADRIVTMMPAAPAEGGLAGLERAVARAPRYLSFLRSWQWTIPLWREGVIGAAWEGCTAAEDVGAAHKRIARDDRYAALRPLMREEFAEDGDRCIEAIAADLLKGGPDPGISVPLAAGLDRFAIRHGAFVARTEPVSIAQKAEARLGRRLFAAAVPVLLQASGERLMWARSVLEPELGELRSAVDEAVEALGAGDTPGAESREAIAGAAGRYAAAFEREREEIIRGKLVESDDEPEVRTVEGVVTLTAMLMPEDVVLASSVEAMDSLGGRKVNGRVESARNGHALAERDPLAGRSVLALIVKAVGRGANGR